MTASLKRQAAVQRHVEEEMVASAASGTAPLMNGAEVFPSSPPSRVSVADAGISTHDAFTRHLKIIDAIFGGKL